jgi:hypothetical protein
MAATLHETDGDGDSTTQVVSFGTVVPLPQLPAVEQAVENTCSSALLPARALALPFTVVTTLNSSVPFRVPLVFNVNTFQNSQGISHGYLGTVVGDYTSGISCPQYVGGSTTLSSQGSSDTFKAWLIFPDAITPNHPDGDMKALGETYLEVDSLSIQRATGPAVCNSGGDGSSPPYLHVGGRVFGFEGCTGTYRSAS